MTVRARATIDTLRGGRDAIIVTEIPYMVNKAALVERIAALVKEGSVAGISDIRDESDRDGMRIVIELKRDAQPRVVLNQLYKHTQMQTTFGANMLALVGNRPRGLEPEGDAAGLRRPPRRGRRTTDAATIWRRRKSGPTSSRGCESPSTTWTR